MADRQPLAIAFSDLRGFTTYTAERGDEEALRIARAFTDLVEEQLARQQGRLLKTYGDGVMTSFDDAESAVLCTIGMQTALSEHNETHADDPLCAGIGLTWGPAIRTSGDLFGHSVNLAKRLADVAKGCQIVVAPAVVEQTQGRRDFVFRDLGEQDLKGLGAQRLYELVWREEVAKMSLPDDTLDFVLTEDKKLVLEFAKPIEQTLKSIHERLQPRDGDKGAAARLKRQMADRLLREIPRWVDAWRRYGGAAVEHRLDEIDASIEAGALHVRLPEGKELTFGDRQIDLAEAERFLAKLAALKAEKPAGR